MISQHNSDVDNKDIWKDMIGVKCRRVRLKPTRKKFQLNLVDNSCQHGSTYMPSLWLVEEGKSPFHVNRIAGGAPRGNAFLWGITWKGRWSSLNECTLLICINSINISKIYQNYGFIYRNLWCYDDWIINMTTHYFDGVALKRQMCVIHIVHETQGVKFLNEEPDQGSEKWILLTRR